MCKNKSIGRTYGLNNNVSNISKDTMIFDGQIMPGDPKNISVIVEIEDMKGNKTELYGYRSLSVGDFTYFVNTEE